MRFKRGMIVELHDVTGTDVTGFEAVRCEFKYLVGEIIGIEGDRILILFLNIDRCAWFDKDMDIRPASKTARILYG